MKVYSASKTDSISVAVAQRIVDASQVAIANHGAFHVAISGGSLPAIVAKALVPLLRTLDPEQLKRWHWWFADERAVPLDHADSNYRLVQELLLDPLAPGISMQVHPAINSTLLPDLDACAQEYTQLLRQSIQPQSTTTTTTTTTTIATTTMPVLDLVLLGMGPDGHTCSLFPDHADYQQSLVQVPAPIVFAVRNSPKPPPNRVTLSMQMLDVARSVVLVVTGDGKRSVLQQILEPWLVCSGDSPPKTSQQKYPAGRVLEKNHANVVWYLDDPAASYLLQHEQLVRMN